MLSLGPLTLSKRFSLFPDTQQKPASLQDFPGQGEGAWRFNPQASGLPRGPFSPADQTVTTFLRTHSSLCFVRYSCLVNPSADQH